MPCTVRGTRPAFAISSDAKASDLEVRGFNPGLLIANETFYQLSYTPVIRQ